MLINNKKNNNESGIVGLIILIVILIIGALIIVGLVVGEESDTVSSEIENAPVISLWPQEAIDVYVENCVDGAPDDLNANKVARYCGCNVDKFQEKYATIELFEEAVGDTNSTYESYYSQTTSKCAELAGL